MVRKLAVALISAFWMLGLIAPAITPSFALAQSQADYAIPNGHFYSQANGHGGAGGTGYTIVDTAQAPFWTGFQQMGGVNAIGYPISQPFMWDGFLVQATQRVVMQWHPDTKSFAFVNVYDRMHDLGKDPTLQAVFSIPAPSDTSPDTGLTWAKVEARHLAFLNADPKLKAKYFATSAFGDPVVFNGLPMSPIVNAGPFNIIRCQRISIQDWLVDDPAAGIHAGDVTVTLGADQAKGLGIFPNATALQPIPAPAPSGGPGNPTPVPVTSSGFHYGLQAHQYNGAEQPVINAINAAGFPWVKQQVEWKGIQPNSASDQNWGELDTVVNADSAAGLHIMLSIVQAPVWARSNPNNPFPKNPSDLANFFTLMATHYKGKVAAYEVWNEENFAREVGPGNINAGNYVELLKASFTAIKAADPNAIVVSGAPTPTGVNDPNIAIDDNVFIQQMYAYQGGIVKSYFDVLGAHAEAWANPPSATVGSPEPPNVTGFNNDPSFFFRRLEQYRADMVAAGDGNKNIWETEFGYDSCPDPNPAPSGYEYCKWISEQQQADYLVQAFQYARTNYPWLGAMFIWNLNFQAQVANTDEKWGFGILRSDYSPRPAYTALQAMAKT